MTLDGVMEAPEKWVFRFWNDELARANSGQKPEHGAPSVINLADPARGEDANEFQGYRHDAGVSFIVVDAPPGGGPKLHRHPYEEVFVVQEGTATFTAGEEIIEA